MMHRLFVDAIGFAAPGFPDATSLAAHFAGAPPAAVPVEGWDPMPKCLPRRQALRLSQGCRLAILVAAEIGETLEKGAGWVFASSVGEGWALDQIMTALCQPEIMIQPLRFQNSVHNAAQGQWSIASGAVGAMSSIAAYDYTFGSGLLKACMQAVIEGTSVGLVTFDVPMPPPLHEKRPWTIPMAAALAISPTAGSSSRAVIDFEVVRGLEPTDPARMDVAESLLTSGNPVRFALPLLEAVDRPEGSEVVLALSVGANLRLSISAISHRG